MPIHTHAEIRKEALWKIFHCPGHHSLVQKIRMVYPRSRSTMNIQSRFPALTPNLNRDVRLELLILYVAGHLFLTHSKRGVVVVLKAQKKAFFLDSEKESFHPMTIIKKLFDKNLLKQTNCMKSSPDLFLIFIFPYFFIN